MSEINYSFIERYQKVIEQDPKSKVFAPLAEAYRKMGLLREAKDLCERGLKHHPEFSGGHFAMAKILVDQGDLKPAAEHLERVVEQAPENISAQSLLADICLRLKEPKKALRAFKMVLFVNPTHEKALAAVQKLESLTADEFDSDVFAIEKLRLAVQKMGDDSEDSELDLESPSSLNEQRKSELLERYISLVDAFIARSDIEKAYKALDEAERQLGPHPEISKRSRLMKRLEGADHEPAEPIKPVPRPEDVSRSRRIERLKKWLNQVREREHVRP